MAEDFSLSKNVFVGAGAHDGPPQNVTNLPEIVMNRGILPPGRRGAAPYSLNFGLSLYA